MQTHIKTFEQLTTKELFHIYKLRVDTFVEEQQCPYHEIDDIDLIAHHIYLQQNTEMLAYCRLYHKNNAFHIGRVIAAIKHKGYGTQIMKTAIKFATQKLHVQSINIEAQNYAKKFYEKLGFVTTSEPFDEDGIQHIKMKYTVK